MAVQCPHCGATVELNRRHGLSGALCPECHHVVPMVESPELKSTPAPRIVRPQRAEVRPTCRACGGNRDREARRCPACGEPWLYRVGALGVEDEDARARLVEYVMHRQSQAVARERLEQRFKRFPAPVLGALTEAQAFRARHELENIGVQVALEEDDTSAVQATRPGFRFDWTWLVVPALLVFAVGVYLLVQSEREARAREATRAAQMAAPATQAPATQAPDAPQDVLAGLARVESAGREGYGIMVDRDGWFIAALSLVDRAGGVTVTLGGQQARGALVRRDDRLGLGLFRAATPVAFTLSLGDVSTLTAGDPLFVAREGARGTELARVDVVRPDARRGARLFLAVQAAPAVEAAIETIQGAPLFNREGFVVGMLLPRPGTQHGLAVPANLLVEDPGSLLAEIRAPRKATATFAGWRARVETEARQENPEIYDAVEKRLLLSLKCDDARCEAEVGLLAFGALPPLTAPLTFDFQDVDQLQTAREPRHGQQLASPGPAEWVEVTPAESPLIQDAAVGARRAIVGGDVDGLRLHMARITLQRPVATRGQPFRVVAAGFDGHCSAGTVVGLPAPESAPATAPPSAIGSAAPEGPTRDTPFGELKAGESADRFQVARDAVAAQEKLVARQEADVAARKPGAEALLVGEKGQLDRLRQRLATLTTDADRWKLPAEFRR